MIFNISKDIKFSLLYKKLNIFSLILIALSISFLLFKGLNLGVDFKGGTLIEIRTENSNINIAEIRQSFLNMDLGDVTVKSINDKLSSDLGSQINFRRVENVGPKVSNELLRDGLLAISLSLAAMLFYIWIRFEWQFSLGAILALVHDVIITLGIFSLLTYEINLSIVAAVLTIVGYSMNDTVVIFDRIRENLKKYSKISTLDICDTSINQTLSRTLITSVTTLLALLSIYIFGGEILKGFSFAMIIGVIVGTYSSIFVAATNLNYTKVSQKTVLKEDIDKY